MNHQNGHYIADKIHVHSSNLNLHKKVSSTGLVGFRQSELINRLTAKIEGKKISQVVKQKSQIVCQDVTNSRQRIQELLKEENNLKREMVRISDISKGYKNAKIATDIKYESLLKDYEKRGVQINELNQKLKATNELNNCLLKITQNTLSVLPHYQSNCQQLQHYIISAKQKLQNRVSKQLKNSGITTIMEDLYKKIDSFKVEVDSMQSYQKKMMGSLAQAHLESKSVSERLSVMSNINFDQLISFREELGHISDSFHTYDPSESFVQRPVSRFLMTQSEVNTFTYIPESAPRFNKIFTEICMLFEQHIHLLQHQKMEYQFTKNKKLLACQQVSCQICDNYEKIVSQTFSIVRQAFKQIKFQLLKEIRQISDVNEIPILI